MNLIDHMGKFEPLNESQIENDLKLKISEL
jgi:hypothetical protein